MKKVVAMRCREYDPEAVKIKLEAAMEALGGLRQWIKPGDRVLLKVNLLTGKIPEEAVTTHPQVVIALADLLMEAGASVSIADSPAGPFSKGRLKKVYRLTGMERIESETGAKLNWNLESQEIHYSEGYRLKSFAVLQAVLETDHIINICKMKTHSMTLMTGAVKNMFGIMPGLKKAELHFRFTEPEDFAHAMVDICEYAQPTLSVMDGIDAMEGAGPSAGDIKKAGVLLVSKNPHALDAVAAKYMGVDPLQVPTLRVAEKRNLCSLSEDELEIQGVEMNGSTPFKLPDTQEPDFLERYSKWPVIGNVFRRISRKHLRPKPVLQKERCISCYECDTICPANAICMIHRRPEFIYDKCIRCYCCQEVCPEKAIWIYRPGILKRLSGS